MFLQSWQELYCILVRSRYNVASENGFIPVQALDFGYWCSVALQSEVGARKLSRCRIFNGSRKRIQVQRAVKNSIVPAGFEMKIKDQKKEKSSGPYSTDGFCEAGVYVTRQKP